MARKLRQPSAAELSRRIDKLVLDCPESTPDGRPFVRKRELDDELALWMPEPMRDGDPVYCDGIQIGTFHGERAEPCESYIETVPTKEMPEKLAAWMRQGFEATARANGLRGASNGADAT